MNLLKNIISRRSFRCLVLGICMVGVTPLAAAYTCTLRGFSFLGSVGSETFLGIPVSIVRNLTLNKGTRIGSVIRTETTSPTFDCTGIQPGDVLGGNLRTDAALVSGYSDVYQTKMPGIGVRINAVALGQRSVVGGGVASDPGAPCTQTLLPTQTLPSGVSCGGNGISAGPASSRLVFAVTVHWIKTADLPAERTKLPLDFYPKVFLKVGGNAGWEGEILTNRTQVYVIDPGSSCKFTAAVPVPFGNVDRGRMPTVGSRTGPWAVNLPVSCKEDSKVRLTFSGLRDTDATGPYYKLDGGSTAQGIAIELTNEAGENAGPDAQKIHDMTTTTSVLRYNAYVVRTKDEMKLGPFSATANVEVDYP